MLTHVWFFATPWTPWNSPGHTGVGSLSFLEGIFLDWTQVSCIAGRFFTSWATREAQNINYRHNYIYSIKYRQSLIMYLLNTYTYMYVLCIYVYICVHMSHIPVCTMHVCSSSLGCPCIALVGTIVRPISVPVSRRLWAEGRLPVAFSDSGHITNRVSLSLDEP